MRNNDKGEFIIINELDKYYKYNYSWNGVFTTDINRAKIRTSYKECVNVCRSLSKDRKLKIVDKQIAFRKYKLEKLNNDSRRNL